MKFLSLIAVASMALAKPLKRSSDSPLDVKLEMTGNTEVKATVTNTGNQDLKVFAPGTILCDSAVQKVSVSNDAGDVDFDGIDFSLDWSRPADDSNFQTIAAGQSVENTFDVGQTHDLSAGGKFTISASGSLAYASEVSNAIAGRYSFKSNEIEANVDGDAAKLSFASLTGRPNTASVHSKRFKVLNETCTEERAEQLLKGARSCVIMATEASQAALSGSASRMTEYFKSNTTKVRQKVSGIFDRVVENCAIEDGGAGTMQCSDGTDNCATKSTLIAYVWTTSGEAHFCDLYFTNYQLDVTNNCYKQSQTGTVVHESTHIKSIGYTDDYDSTYGYNALRGLTAEQNQNHAGTYEFFAMAVHAGC